MAAMASCAAAMRQPSTISRRSGGVRAVSLRPFGRSLAAQPLTAAAAAPAAPRRGAVAVQAAAAAPAAQQQKIRIKLKSYWVDLLQDSVEKIREAASSTGATIAGPVPLPTRKKIYTVLRSPHVNKDSREQFEVRLHQRLIDVKDLSSQTVDRLMSLDLPAGVDVEVKL